MSERLSDSAWAAVVALLSQQYEGVTRQTLEAALENKPEDRYLTSNEACDFLRCTRMTLYRFEKFGKIHPRRLGSKLLYSFNELKSLVEK